jgi:hypothetical protein
MEASNAVSSSSMAHPPKSGNSAIAIPLYDKCNYFDLADRAPTLRLLTVFGAFLVLVARMPHLFLAPQFWAEDGFLFHDAYVSGFCSIWTPLGGYLLFATRLVACITNLFPLKWTPALYLFESAAFALAVVYLITSPRISIPFRYLAALTVVSVASGWEMLLGLANTQWLAPIGIIALLLMHAHELKFVLFAEAVFVAMTALTGPFCFFFAPIFMFCAYRSRRAGPAERGRLIVLAATAVAFTTPQAITVAMRLGEVAVNVPYAPIDWAIPIITPLRRFSEVLYPLNRLVKGGAGIFASAVAVPISVWVVWRQPYRYEKTILAVFAYSVLYAGMWRYHNNLSTLVNSNQRYVFFGSVFFVWTLAYFSAGLENKWQRILHAFLIFAVANSIFHTIGVERPRVDLDWSGFANQLLNGKRAQLPVAPDWLVSF